MKKNMKKAIMMAMVLALALAPVAQADTIFSPTFRFYGVEEQPTEVPTAEPTVEPTAEPVAEPTEEPAAEPVEPVTEEPTAEPEATAEPTAEPEVAADPEPAAEPQPEISLSISSNLAGRTIVPPGTKMVLTMNVEGAEGRAYTIQWQQSTDDGATWIDVPGANAEQYVLKLAPEHSGMIWRVTIDIEDSAANE